MSDEGTDWLEEVLRETDLQEFYDQILTLQITKIEHWKFVKPEDLEKIGLSRPSVRRLLDAVHRKRTTKKKLFAKLTGRNETIRGRPDEVAKSNSADHLASLTCLIHNNQLQLYEKLGEGSFSVVKRAIWLQPNGRKVNVAAKILHDHSAAVFDDFSQEVNLLHQLKNDFIIHLYGVVFTKPVIMVVELCEGGSLLDRLRSSNKPRLLVSQLWRFARQIIRGMAYLEEKHVIHRDLAARNVLLVSEQKIKIGDFGLVRSLADRDEHYTMSGQKKVPVAWCAPESLKRKNFSHSSDVFMFAVTLWECFSYGEILTKLLSSERLQKPENCPATIYDLMLKCWRLEPNERPTFASLKQTVHRFGFLSATVIEAHPKQSSDQLDLIVGDTVLIIDGAPENFHWFGQCQRSREFGKFTRKSIKFNELSRTAEDNRNISRPIQGSFMHTGHGDARGGESWGFPDRIDQLYLRNPMPLLSSSGQAAAAAMDFSTSTLSSHGIPYTERSSKSCEESLLSFEDDGTFPPDDDALSLASFANSRQSSFQTSKAIDLSGSSLVEFDKSNPARHSFDAFSSCAKVIPPPPVSSRTLNSSRNRNVYYSLVPQQKPLQVPSIPVQNKVINGPELFYDLPPSEPVAPLPERKDANSTSLTRKLSVPTFLSTVEASTDPKPGRESGGCEQLNQPQQRASWASSGANNSTGSSYSSWGTPPPQDPDPFEVPQDIRQLAQKKRYADHYSPPQVPIVGSTVVQEFGNAASVDSSMAPPTASNNAGSKTVSAVQPSFGLLPQPACAATALRGAYTANAYNSNSLVYNVNWNNSCSQVRAAAPTSIAYPTFAPPLNAGTAISCAWASQSNALPVNSATTQGFGPVVETNDNLVNELKNRLNLQMNGGAMVTAVSTSRPFQMMGTPSVADHVNVRAKDLPATEMNSAASLATAPYGTLGLSSSSSRFSDTSAFIPSAANVWNRPVTAVIPVPPAALPASNVRAGFASAAPNASRGLASLAEPLRPTPLASQPTAADPSVLNLFDPLTNAVPDHLVAAVQKAVAFANADRCRTALKRANLSVGHAVQDLKLEKLADLGLGSRDQCRAVLERCGWDVNNAAASLLETI